MEAIFQDDGLLRANPQGTLNTLKLLGVDRVRLFLPWYQIAPNYKSRKAPKNFNAADPGKYPAPNWASYDTIIKDAQAVGINIDLTVTGPAPFWATGGGQPSGGPHLQWKPNAFQFRLFVQAVGTRYSGSYNGLPRVNFWSVWNEPNYGPDLAPQAINRSSIETSPTMYRQLLDSAWKGLQISGHGNDTILFGELAPRGYGSPPVFPGDFAGMRPLQFLRALYCVDRNYHRLHGNAAAVRGCPTSGSSAAFRGAHPALFQASGFAAHPYPQGQPPNVLTSNEPDFADLPALPNLGRILDRLQNVWGSSTRFPIWSTEYGYQTRPPDTRFRQPPPATAAYYLNWAEYISYRNPRIKSFMQYLLVDPPLGNFPSALQFKNGSHKATFDAWRLPLYLPATSARKGHTLEVWGDVRPADLFMGAGQQVQVQFQPGSHGAWQTVATPSFDAHGYFDTRVMFPGSGSVRLTWSYPAPLGYAVHSRTEKITVR
jgi:hypothetical protein